MHQHGIDLADTLSQKGLLMSWVTVNKKLNVFKCTHLNRACQEIIIISSHDTWYIVTSWHICLHSTDCFERKILLKWYFLVKYNNVLLGCLNCLQSRDFLHPNEYSKSVHAFKWMWSMIDLNFKCISIDFISACWQDILMVSKICVGSLDICSNISPTAFDLFIFKFPMPLSLVSPSPFHVSPPPDWSCCCSSAELLCFFCIFNAQNEHKICPNRKAKSLPFK